MDGTGATAGVDYVAAKIEQLPFPDRSFDTVVCTHVLEHILDYRSAIAELRRIVRRRLIIVVPREREYKYTFNPHFNFFPYPHSFLRAMHPVPADHVCADLDRDIYYRETSAAVAPPAALCAACSRARARLADENPRDGAETSAPRRRTRLPRRRGL